MNYCVAEDDGTFVPSFSFLAMLTGAPFRQFSLGHTVLYALGVSSCPSSSVG